MADFMIAYKPTMGHEGYYAYDPDDPGGETWKGISRKNWPNWHGWQIIDEAKKGSNFPSSLKDNGELEFHVQEFYKEHFFEKNSLHLIRYQAIVNEVFDTGVNCGSGIAAEFLQRVVNAANRDQKDYPDIKVDGDIGNKTITALTVLVERRGYDIVIQCLNILQGNRYFEIMERRPVLEKYFFGWLKRALLRSN